MNSAIISISFQNQDVKELFSTQIGMNYFIWQAKRGSFEKGNVAESANIEAQFAEFQLENGLRTVVGRDNQKSASSSLAIHQLYLERDY